MHPTQTIACTSDIQTGIGLLLCKSKDSIVAEYALRGHSTPIGVAEWSTVLTESLPEELASTLPSISELEAELSHDISE